MRSKSERVIHRKNNAETCNCRNKAGRKHAFDIAVSKSPRRTNAGDSKGKQAKAKSQDGNSKCLPSFSLDRKYPLGQVDEQCEARYGTSNYQQIQIEVLHLLIVNQWSN
jgi:hypothetical protein